MSSSGTCNDDLPKSSQTGTDPAGNARMTGAGLGVHRGCAAPGASDRAGAAFGHQGLPAERLSTHTAVTKTPARLSPGSPRQPRDAQPGASAAVHGDEHRGSIKNFKSSSNSYRNGEDERNEASKSRQVDRWLLWSKKYNQMKKNRSSRALFEGAKRR